HLVELCFVGDLAERTNLYAGRAHVDGQRRDALLLRRVGVGAREAQPPIRELGVARPDLLAVEDPAVVGRRRARGDRRQVTARSGLAEALAPQLLRGEDLRQPALLLLGRA